MAIDDALGSDDMGIGNGRDCVGVGTTVFVRQETVDVVTVTSANVLVTLHLLSLDVYASDHAVHTADR